MLHFFDLAYLIASMILTLTFFIFPPPTDKIKRASFEEQFEAFNHDTKELFHPLSLIRAVNSETLSTGV